MTVAGKISAQMVEAQRLVTKEGKTAYAAAKAVGLTKGAIYRAPWYKEWVNGKAKG